MRAFFRFWYDFIVGDDWRLAVSVAVIIGIAALLVAAGVSAWWFTPPAIAAALATSLRRAVRDA